MKINQLYYQWNCKDKKMFHNHKFNSNHHKFKSNNQLSNNKINMVMKNVKLNNQDHNIVHLKVLQEI